jgi:hypothetical protein
MKAKHNGCRTISAKTCRAIIIGLFPIVNLAVYSTFTGRKEILRAPNPQNCNPNLVPFHIQIKQVFTVSGIIKNSQAYVEVMRNLVSDWLYGSKGVVWKKITDYLHRLSFTNTTNGADYV